MNPRMELALAKINKGENPEEVAKSLKITTQDIIDYQASKVSQAPKVSVKSKGIECYQLTALMLLEKTQKNIKRAEHTDELVELSVIMRNLKDSFDKEVINDDLEDGEAYSFKEFLKP